MRRFRCRVCGDDTGTSDSHLCGRCACLTIEQRVEVERALRTGQMAPSQAAIPQPTPRPELPTADRTTDSRPLADPDPLARYRRALLSQRSFGALAYAQAR